MIYLVFFLAIVAFVFAMIAAGLRRKLAASKEDRDYDNDLKIGGTVCMWIARAGGALAAVFLIFSCLTVVSAGHVGVQVLFGGVRPIALTEGLNVINPLLDIVEMSVRTETYTMSAVVNEGKTQGDDSIQALSSDGLLMPLDITIAYRLVGSDAPRVYRNIGADYVDKVIRPSSRTAVREAIAGFTAQEAYSTKRNELQQTMHDLLAGRVKQLLEQREDFKGATGFIVDQVMIRNIQLPTKVKTAIEAKLEAAQQAEQMQFVLQKERQEAERKRIEARGIADFQQIVTQGISQPLLEWKGIEATLEIAKSPNAKVIVIGAGKGGLPVILNPGQ